MNVWIDLLPLFCRQIFMALRFPSQPYENIIPYFLVKVN